MLVSQSDLEAKLGRTLTASEVTLFTILNNALQAYVERLIGSDVEAVEATTRYFDGGQQHVGLPPFTDATAVKIVDDDQIVTDTLDTTDYTLEPSHRTIKSMLRWRSGRLTRGINNIAITAKFSIYADEDIRNLVKYTLLEAIAAELNNANNIKSESIEGYSVTYIEDQAREYFAPLKYLFPGV